MAQQHPWRRFIDYFDEDEMAGRLAKELLGALKLAGPTGTVLAGAC